MVVVVVGVVGVGGEGVLYEELSGGRKEIAITVTVTMAVVVAFL